MSINSSVIVPVPEHGTVKRRMEEKINLSSFSISPNAIPCLTSPLTKLLCSIFELLNILFRTLECDNFCGI